MREKTRNSGRKKKTWNVNELKNSTKDSRKLEGSWHTNTQERETKWNSYLFFNNNPLQTSVSHDFNNVFDKKILQKNRC